MTESKRVDVSEVISPIFSLVALMEGNKPIFHYKNKITGDFKTYEQFLHKRTIYAPNLKAEKLELNKEDEISYEASRRAEAEWEDELKLKRWLERKAANIIDLKNQIESLINQKNCDWDLVTQLIKEYFLENEHIYTTRDDENAEMWIYKEGIYIPEAKTYIREFCKDLLKQKLTAQQCNKVIFKIEVDTYIDQDEFFINKDIELVPVLNGVLNIKTKELLEFNPKYIFFNKLNMDYDPNIINDVFQEFFEEIVSIKDVPVIQELFGYCLFRNYKIHKSFMFNGYGCNGKGTTLNLLENFINVKNITDLTLKDMEQDNFTLIRLHNKMVNISGDIDDSFIECSGTFKKLTGNDTITAKRKFKTDVSFKNYAKMIFACNDLPKFKDNSDGQWRRWVLIDFPFKFVEPAKYDALEPIQAIKDNIKRMNVDKVENLTTTENMTALLNWALVGLDRILENGSLSEGNSQNVRDIWKMKNNTVIRFVNEKCVLEYGQSVALNDFKTEYGKFCQKNHIKTEKSKIITETLEQEFGIFPNRKNTGMMYDGINLK